MDVAALRPMQQRVVHHAPARASPRRSASRGCRRRGRGGRRSRPCVGLPSRSIERRGLRIELVGLIAIETVMSWPVEMPPSTPPALLPRKPSGVSSSPWVVPRCATEREAGADLDALDRVDAHHRVGDVGVELVVERLAEADRHAAARRRRCARRSCRRPCAARPRRPRCAAMSLGVGGEERVVRHDVLHRPRTGSRSRRSASCGRRSVVPCCCCSHLRATAPAPTIGAVRRADARPPPRGSRRPYLCR